MCLTLKFGGSKKLLLSALCHTHIYYTPRELNCREATNLAERVLGWWCVVPTSVPLRHAIKGVACVQTSVPLRNAIQYPVTKRCVDLHKFIVPSIVAALAVSLLLHQNEL